MKKLNKNILIIAALAGFVAIFAQNYQLLKENKEIKAELEIIQYQQDRHKAQINKLLTPQQINQLRGERILESLNDTTSKNKSIKMEVDDVR